MATYHQALRNAIKRCKNEDISDECLQILLVELCGLTNAKLYECFEDDMPENILNEYNLAVERLVKHEPLQYILGYQYFYGYKMKVSSGTLIPRYETEELVANVLADSDYFFKDLKEISIADIGTGSGNIAFALKMEEPKFKMYATDISNEALQTAKENANDYHCDITFMQGDMLQPIIDAKIKLDILVSNPPYIPINQQVQKSVDMFEPHVALFGGDDGLYFYRKIFENAYKVIKDKAFLAFEIGFDEKDALIKEIKKYFPNDTYEFIKDINGKDRMLFIYHNLQA